MSFSRTPEWNVWANIKQRCFNDKNPSYYRYGGRGITMYEPWINDFKAFRDYIGIKPDPRLTIERIDNDGNYEPGNLRWATRHDQNMNKTYKKGINKLSREDRYRRYSMGTSGISFRKSVATVGGKNWWVIMTIDGKRKSMGLYYTKDEAEAALKDFAEVYYGDKI